MKVRRAKRIAGEISLPGDKSISHRAAMMSAIAEGSSSIANFAASADCASTLACLRDLGVSVERSASDLLISGVGKTGFRRPGGPLDCGNSGTTMRLMSGIVAGQDFDTTLTGDASLRSRPMKRVIEPLARMGAAADSAGGCAPLTIHGQGARLRPIDYELPVASAQIKSCVLLAGLYADGRTSVVEPTPTRDHTERMLRWFGVEVDEEPAGRGKRISVTGDSVLKGGRLTVPSDVSAATFFAVAAACLPGSEVKLRNVGLNPTRVGAIATIRRFGGQVSILNQSEDYGEPVGDLKLKGGIEKIDQGIPNFVWGDLIANLIDEIPILAVLGTQLEGGIEIREAAELRVKESDRINAVVDNLGRMGADVEEFDDGLRIRRSRLRGAVVDSFGDHRIAMSFAIAGLIADGETEIVGAECVDVSFPGFFDELERVAEY